jgi:phosphate starvation-inducible PhoH-like protein
LERELEFQSLEEERAFLGTRDANRRRLQELFGVGVSSRGGVLRITGEEPDRVEAAARAAGELLRKIRRGDEPQTEEVLQTLNRFVGGGARRGGAAAQPDAGDRVIGPKSEGQRRYLEAMDRSEIVFSIGPAGTGKTYLAVAKAVSMLQSGAVRKLVLARPAVEAGEKLGFLPGDYQAKVNPYLRPLYDALNDLLDFGRIKRYMERDVIEIVPLAYMRGRTLGSAFIILDEAQNTTSRQMLMFLTRMGEGSRIVITGDVTQIDLPEREVSGLVDAGRVLEGIAGVEFVTLTRADIVRHPLVQEIVDAYGRDGRDVPPGRRRRR